jgi:autotransporter-associated beta strand protein
MNKALSFLSAVAAASKRCLNYLVLTASSKRCINYLALTACLLAVTTSGQAAEGTLKIHMFASGDGRGDCFVIELPDNTRMIVDIPSGWTSDLRSKLSSIGISNVKYLVGTHEHIDHIGGMDAFLDSPFTVNNTQVYYPKGGVNANSSQYHNLVAAAGRRSMTLTKLVAGDYILNTTHDGKPLKVRVLSPENDKVNGGSDDWGGENDASMVLKVQYGTKAILLQADCWGYNEMDILSGPFASEINNCQVLKVGHHGTPAPGGTTSTRTEYLDAADVNRALITNGDKTLSTTIRDRLRSRNIRYWSTGTGDGYCWLSTDGVADWVESEAPLWPVPVKPSIITQPASQSVTPGSTVNFNVTATGTAPLSYQWRFKGTNISGATTSSYTKINVQSTNAGNYSVVVGNSVGNVTSANAVLFVNAPPELTTQLVLNDNFNVTSGTTGFALGNGINFGINPPTTRLIGIASTNLRYMQTYTNKPASVYSIDNNALRIRTNSNVGRFTLSANGVTPFDFSAALGVSNASPARPIVYEIRLNMRNDSTSAARFSFGISTAEGDINAMDCAVQVYRNVSGDNFYTVAQRVDTNSSGTNDFELTTLTTTAPANTVNTFLPILIRITDAGAESGTNYNSRAQISINNGTNWIFDTDTDTTELPNGWRFDGAGRYFLFDIAGNSSADVYYDEFSVKLLPTWIGSGNDNHWSIGANWNGGTPENGDSLYFAGTNRLAPFVESDYAVGAITFLPGAGSFNIGAAAETQLLLGGDILQSSANAQTISVPISLSATRTITTPSGALTLSGEIGGAGGITKASTGSLTLSGTNTYSGKTTISRGTIFFNSIDDVGAGPSALGEPNTVADGTINLGSGTTATALRYTGPGHTTDRVINLSSTTGGAGIYGSGTGPIVFTSDFTATGAGSKTLTLRGTSTHDNTIGGAIVNNSTTNITSLTKTDAGKWILDGVSTYTGSTTISAGTLEVNGSISSTSAVSVAAAGTLSGIGTVGPVSVSGTISGGVVIGKLTTGALTLNSSGVNWFEISEAIGNPGESWDVVDAGVNSVNVLATSAAPFKFKLNAIDLVDFDPDASYSWPAIVGSVQNFSADKFTIDDIAFTNDLRGGTFSVANTGSSLNVQFMNNRSPVAQPTNVTFAAGTPFTVSISELLANLTSDPDGDLRILVSVTSTNAGVSTNATHITINSANSSTESIGYVVRDARNYRAGDTVRTAAGYINIVVTNAANGGVVTISNNGGNASLNFVGDAGQNYIIQRSQDLVGWTNVSTNTAAGDGSIQFSETPPHNPAYYRTRKE